MTAPKSNVADFPAAAAAEEQAQLTGALSEMSPKLIKDIQQAASTLEQIGERRSALNAESKQVYANLSAEYGANALAIRNALAYLKLPEDKRDNYDLTYRAARHAMGAPIQDDLFEAALRRDIERSTAAKRRRAKEG